MLDQDLHIHTVLSTGDDAVAPEQTVELIAALQHARIVGISDHLEYLVGRLWEPYESTVRSAGLKVGMEIDGHRWVEPAIEISTNDYFVVHCYDQRRSYRSLETLLETGKPVIIAHPNALGTDLARVPPECLIEINNRYVWRSDWERYYRPHVQRFRFILSSDAHQPHWLNHTVARHVASALGVCNTLPLSRQRGRGPQPK
jgi:histidinol phosphatase-like PHP family hydrolase